MNNIKTTNLLLLIIVILLVFYILKVLSFIFIPLILSMFIALMFLPFIRWMKKHGVPGLIMAVPITVFFKIFFEQYLSTRVIVSLMAGPEKQIIIPRKI